MDGKKIGSALPVAALCLAVALVASATPSLAVAGDRELRQAMTQLDSQDEAARQRAIDELVQSNDGRLADFMTSLFEGSVYLWHGQAVICDEIEADASGAKMASLRDPITQEPLLVHDQPVIVPVGEIREISVSRAQRAEVQKAARVLALWSPNAEQRLSAIEKAGETGNPSIVKILEEIRQQDGSQKIRHTARESVDLLRATGKIPDVSRADQLSAVRDLGEIHSARASSVLQDALDKLDRDVADKKPVDAAAREVYQRAIDQIENYQRLVRTFDYVKSGVSLGSILILMALGLAITFGVMGVINMAHGELMMIGAYATYYVSEKFQENLSPHIFNWYYVVAFPVAFFAAAFCGYLIERFVVRHLYGRPLDTLLATFGVSWILIQAVRVKFGDNIGVKAPTWLRGGVEVMQDMVLPYNRFFLILLCIFCVLIIYVLMNYTKLGLQVRATMQNREMAAALGVNTRRIDGYTFALGAGMAGLAGYGLTIVDGVTPDMGQNYIIQSFLVVVTGGVGELAGTIYAGLGLGVLNKIFEPFLGAVWGQVLILVCIVVFLQWRPAGLFPPKGRAADV